MVLITFDSKNVIDSQTLTIISNFAQLSSVSDADRKKVYKTQMLTNTFSLKQYYTQHELLSILNLLCHLPAMRAFL